MVTAEKSRFGLAKRSLPLVTVLPQTTSSRWFGPGFVSLTSAQVSHGGASAFARLCRRPLLRGTPRHQTLFGDGTWLNLDLMSRFDLSEDLHGRQEHILGGHAFETGFPLKD
jgi:hypothetical protein